MKSSAICRTLLKFPMLNPNREIIHMPKSCYALICNKRNYSVKHSNTSLQDILKRHQPNSDGNLVHAGDHGHVKSSRTKLYYRIKHYIKDDVDAKDFVKHLKDQERNLLLSALEDHNNIANGIENGGDEKFASTQQLRLVFLHNCFPFIGFGFLDNAIMIFAGEYIDMTIGITLGITTMAAAAFGNLISDLAGIGLAGYVEALCGKMGLPVAQLTPEQAEMNGPRFASYLGKAFGIIIGCILGMFPLLFAQDKACDTCVTHECPSETEIKETNNPTTPT